MFQWTVETPDATTMVKAAHDLRLPAIEDVAGYLQVLLNLQPADG